ncbi:nitrogen regulatory IIA protein [Flavobacterium sp. FlaQc-30]|uniref:nitrogen regulatory IIA protein n=1 Tax=Flavobacterium sp. FlaQc-30 TaxID=3374179 RepID=UPI003756676E
MEKLRANIDMWLERLDKDWEAMPIKRQHQVILYFFTAYALLTAVIIFNVCRDTAHAKNTMAVEQMQNPAQPEKESQASVKDTLKTILKK